MASQRTTDSSDVQLDAQLDADARIGGERHHPANSASPQKGLHAVANASSDSPENPTQHQAADEHQTRRDSSPLPPPVRPSARLARSRRNSQELSPSRPTVNTFSHPTPSAAAIQRALSANKAPPTTTAIDNESEIRKSKSTGSTSRWPTSPRLTSPPPSTIRSPVQPNRKQDNDMAAPNTSQKRTSPPAHDIAATAVKANPDNQDIPALRPNPKTPGRGPSTIPAVLETVSENGVPDTQGSATPSERSVTSSMTELGESHSTEASQETYLPKSTRGSGDSESDSVGAKASVEIASAPPPVPAAGGTTSSNLTRKPSTNLAAAKAKVVEPLTRSMTVETETVTAVPQAPMNGTGERGASGKLDINGSVRLKPSNETIKPKKERKRNLRRPASINTGTISSKADIFEAKVASAVDEANSSDSDETFVYESNPPEAYIPRSARHHSRTPSTTSLASQLEQRSKSIARDGQHKLAGKRSMKFANYNPNADGEFGVQAAGRGVGKTVTTPRHHHISRHSRTPSHVGLFDNESPFTQATKPSSPRVLTGRSRPSSPRFTGNRAIPSLRKTEVYAYDADDGVTDDERIPLMGSVRANRPRHLRRSQPGGLPQVDYFEEERRSPLSRYGVCLLVSCFFVMLCVGAGSLIVALSKSLAGVSITGIRNVLATEQELMFDLEVRAVNPNLFSITVSDLNIDIFTKSGFAGTAAEWREHGPASPWKRRRSSDGTRNQPTMHTPHAGISGVDEGTDPIENPSADPQTMVLGRVFEFDSALVFESSPVRRQATKSLGEIRLTQPGNKTEEGGSARWEKVLRHPFELIIGGALKYQLPLSSKTRSVPVRSTIKVDPKESNDDGEHLRR